MVAFSACLSTEGVPPSCPTAICAFCDSIASVTSSYRPENYSIWPDRLQIRIEYREPSVNIADAVDAAEPVLNITGDVVGDIPFTQNRRRDESDGQNIGIARFCVP